MTPYLKYLRTAFTQLDHAAQAEASRERNAIAKRLLDALIARAETAERLQADLVSGLHQLAEQDASGELGHLLAQARLVTEPGYLAQGLGTLQASYIETGDSNGLRMAAAVADLERQYYTQFKAAVAAQQQSGLTAEAAGPDGANALDTQRLTAFLRDALDEPQLTISQTSVLAGGYSKSTRAVTLEDVRSCPQEIVLRSDSTAVHSAGSVVHEYALLGRLFEQGLRVPRPLALEPTGSVLGAPFIAVERCPGSTLGSLLVPPPRNPGLAREVAEQLALLHTTPLDRVRDVLAPPAPSATDWVSALVEEDYRNWKALDVPSSIFEAAYAWLRRNVSCNDGAPRVPMHGDYGMQNFLVEGERVCAVLDWEFACIGHAAYDLGYFYDQAESLDSWEAFLAAYAEAGGHVPDAAQLDYNILLCATRFGVMSVRLQKHVESGGEIDEASATIFGHVFIEEFSERTARALAKVLRQQV